MKVGAQLRAIREAQGLSQREAAEKTKGVITYSGLSRVESGARYPSLRSLEALTVALHVSIVIVDGKTKITARTTD